jgi:pimeloyl-ACP methyl ester carboxylesterase
MVAHASFDWRNMSTTAVHERTIDLAGRHYAYREVGDSALPALIAVHGLISHAGAWDDVALGLSDRRHVLAYDLRGHGGSEWSTDYSQDAWVEDLRLFADALGLQRFALIGHTMGARIAWLYAAQHPDRVERLVILDMSPFKPSNFPPAPCDCFATFGGSFPAAREERYAHTRDALFHSFAERSVSRRADGRWYWRCDPRLRSAPTEQPGFAATLDQQWEALRNVTCPVLILSTARNQRLNRDGKEEMVRAVRDGRHIELEDVGHAALLERPEVVVQATREFLA